MAKSMTNAKDEPWPVQVDAAMNTTKKKFGVWQR
jgi:hypothetical protein